MQEKEDLEEALLRIDGRGYKAYRDLGRSYRIGDMYLFIDYVQGDPFASPSRFRLRLDFAKTGIPAEWPATRLREMALADFLARRLKKEIQSGGTGRSGSGKSGRVYVDAGGQEVLERTAVVLNDRFVEARVEAGLPAAGRRILGREAIELLVHSLPAVAAGAFLLSEEDVKEAAFFWKTVENQEALRAALVDRGLVAFIADGSVLPRESGVSDRPLPLDQCVPFQSPDSLRVSFSLPHSTARSSDRKEIHGMGIARGVTLIAGGGYHGKSTLLRALERGVYPHIPGDGREYIVTDPNAVKIRAEDRRRIEGVDISPFIDDLPNGQKTAEFRTDEASGSTSQAASIVEALEAGARVLLVDEDTSATNFMVRDARMQALVNKSHEPITPFVDRVRQLYVDHGVSTILIMGGSGDYFDAADRVIVMSGYRPEDGTDRARTIAQQFLCSRQHASPASFSRGNGRVPVARSVDAGYAGKKVKIDARTLDTLRFGENEIDLRAVEQLVDRSQTRAVGFALYLAARRLMNDRTTLADVLKEIEQLLDNEGLEILDPYVRTAREERHHPGNFARPRRHEIASAINRLRSLEVFVSTPFGEAARQSDSSE